MEKLVPLILTKTKGTVAQISLAAKILSPIHDLIKRIIANEKLDIAIRKRLDKTIMSQYVS